MLNLNWKKVKIIWIYEESKKIIFKIRWKYNNTACPHCGLNTNKRQDQELHKQKQRLRHMPYGWDKIIELELHKRYFRCNNCKTQFYEKFVPQGHFLWSFWKSFLNVYKTFRKIYSMELVIFELK